MHTSLKQVHLDDSATGDLRCECGKLLARVLRTVLELKCPRCKRVVLVVGGKRFEVAGAGPCTCKEDRIAED
jgi:Zn finger protein HypA/HybF involved in hydrogenase expression